MRRTAGHLERSLAGVIQGAELARAKRWNFLIGHTIGDFAESDYETA